MWLKSHNKAVIQGLLFVCNMGTTGKVCKHSRQGSLTKLMRLSRFSKLSEHNSRPSASVTCLGDKNNFGGVYVTNNNFECLRYNYLLCFYVCVTVSLFSCFSDLEYSRWFLSSIFYCLLLVTEIISSLHVLIAIFRLEVCDVIIMSKFVYGKLVYFFYCDESGIVLRYSIAFVVV